MFIKVYLREGDFYFSLGNLSFLKAFVLLSSTHPTFVSKSGISKCNFIAANCLPQRNDKQGYSQLSCLAIE